MMTPILYDLHDDKKVISFSGVDAGAFLQGQTTCDVLELNDKESTFGALCNPKGRVVSLFYVFKNEETFYMVISTEMYESLIKRLKMFVFRSKVTIEDASGDYAVLGANAPLENEVIKPFARVDMNAEKTLAMLIVSVDAYTKLINNSSFNVKTNIDDWRALLTLSFIPDINSETSELFVPQMLNLDILNGISFTKGCYTGQEVVARMHYKGSVKRRLAIYRSLSSHDQGGNVFCANDSNSAGTILNCILDQNNEYAGLMVLKTSYMNDSELQLENKNSLNIQYLDYG